MKHAKAMVIRVLIASLLFLPGCKALAVGVGMRPFFWGAWELRFVEKVAWWPEA
jgi:hypothetical protein